MPDQPTIIVIPTTQPTPTRKGLSTGAKLFLILIILLGGALALMYYLGLFAPSKDCSGIKKPLVCINEFKVLGSKNCCRCITLTGLSDMYEC